MKTKKLLTLSLFSILTFYQSQTQKTDSTKTKNIKEVVLKGSKKPKLIERKIDRMVFNVSNSIASQGMSGLEALRNTPLVKVDEQKGISISGKSGVNVMINGRILNLSESELTNYLQSLRSEDISKIEVITTPPAKYEAQGNSGLINIIMKNSPDLGWSGSLSTSYVRRSENGYSNNLNLNFQNKKISSSLKLRHYDRQKRSSEVNSIDAANSLFSDDKRLDTNKGYGINFTTEFQLNDKSKLGVIYDFANMKNNMDVRNLSDYKTFAIRDSLLSTDAHHRQNAQNHMVNLYYDYDIDSLGKKLSLSANYFGYNPENKINFTTDNLTYHKNEKFKTNNYTKYNVYSAQGDLVLPFEFISFETGAKFSKFNNQSSLSFYRINELPELMTDGLNQFNYNENNYAIYASAEKKLSDKWIAKAGLRYEYSLIHGESPIQNTTEKYNYGQFFPTAYLSYKLSKNNMFTLSYSRRIDRPSFRALNPSRWYQNPYSLAQGNPLLKPSYNNNLELGYSFKGKLNISIYYQKTTNASSQLVSYNKGFKIIDFENMYNENKIGIDISYYETFFKIWEINLIANGYHTKSKAIIPEIVGQKSFNFSYNINNTVSLSSKKNIQLFLNYEQMLPGTFGYYKSDGYSMLNIGGKLSLMQKKMQINVFFEDVLKNAIARGNAMYSDFTMKYKNYYDMRSFNMSLTYNFGKSKVKGVNKKINFDEKNRAN